MSCTRSQEYLAKAGLEIDERTDARKESMGGEAALKLLDDIDELYVTKGKSYLRYDLKKERPDQATLLSALRGPTGNLRAPTLRKGRTLIVGFNQEMYEKVFG